MFSLPPTAAAIENSVTFQISVYQLWLLETASFLKKWERLKCYITNFGLLATIGGNNLRCDSENSNAPKAQIFYDSGIRFSVFYYKIGAPKARKFMIPSMFQYFFITENWCAEGVKNFTFCMYSQVNRNSIQRHQYRGRFGRDADIGFNFSRP